MASQISGNLIAAYSLGKLEQLYFFLIMAGVTLIAIISFLFIRPPDHVPRNMLSNQEFLKKITDVTEDDGIMVSLNESKFEESVHSSRRSTFKEDVGAVVSLINSKRMRTLLP